MVHIFWVGGFGFLGGVFIASFFSSVYFALLVLGLSLVAFFVPRGFLVSVFLCALALGMGRMYTVTTPESVVLEEAVGERVSFEGVVFEEPDVRERSTRLSVRLHGGVGVLVVAPLHVGVQYGDRVRAEGTLRRPESFDTGLGHSFNYPAFLAKDGIQYELSFAEVEVVGEGEWSYIKAVAIFLKQKYLEGLARALPEPHAGLAGGITAGDKRGLGTELSETFRIVGLIHIVVLSGYNIMVVIGFIERVFSRTHRFVRLGFGIVVPVFFALITGLASASVRAAAMATIASVGKATGRTYLAARALMFIALCMVLWNPLLLAFDPGFQLSIIATWGLLFMSPLIEPRLSLFTERFHIREIAATTMGTQLAVLPLILYQSGQLSLVALPANLLALIAVPYAMLASFIAGIGGLVMGPLAPLIALPAYALLSYILTIAEWAARVPYASVTIEAFPAALVIAVYAALLILSVYQKSGSQSRSNSH